MAALTSVRTAGPPPGHPAGRCWRDHQSCTRKKRPSLKSQLREVNHLLVEGRDALVAARPETLLGREGGSLKRSVRYATEPLWFNAEAARDHRKFGKCVQAVT